MGTQTVGAMVQTEQFRPARNLGVVAVATTALTHEYGAINNAGD